MTTDSKVKTWKREVAKVLLLFTGFIAFKSAMADPDPEKVNQALKTLELIITPVTLFAAAAYGMDWASKQAKWPRRADDV